MPTASDPSAIWLIDGPVLFLYVAAIALIYGLREANDKIFTATSREKPLPSPVIGLVTAIANLLAVATLVLCADGLSTAPRLSMLALPVAVLLDRYGRLIYRAPNRRRDPVAALVGSLGGLAAGAWLFMRRAGPERVMSAPVSGNVKTVGFDQALSSDAPWAVSLMLVFAYFFAVAIFFAVHVLVKRIGRKFLGNAHAALGAIAFLLNALGVAALVLASNATGVEARLAMVGFPLFLIVEEYVKLLKTDPTRRPSHWAGLAGSAGGMLLATWFLLKGAPLR